MNMALSTELISQFVKVTNDAKKENAGSDVKGTVVMYEGKAYVKLDGSDQLTPVSTTTELADNERVTVTIKDHQATVMGNTSNPAASTGTASVLKDKIDEFGVIVADTVSTKTFEAEKARIDSLVASDVTIRGRLDAAEADIDDLRAEDVTISGLLTAQRADIDNLSATKADITILESNYAKIENLEATNQYVYNLEATYGEFQVATTAKLEAHDADITNLNANKANIDDLNATNAEIESLKASKADVSVLESDYAKIDLANVNNAWIQNGVIKDASISNEKVISISANKLTAGTIDASKITVTNLNADNLTVGTINGKMIGSGTVDLGSLAEEVPTKAYLDGLAENLQGQIDGQIESWTSTDIPTLSNYPANNWTDAKTRKNHVGDVLYVVNSTSTADGYCYRFSESESGTYSWTLIKDSDVTKALQELIDVQGDVSGLKTFETTINSWKTETDEELSSLKTKQTTLETNLGTKVDTSVFNEVKQTVDSNSSTITTFSETVSSIKQTTDDLQNKLENGDFDGEDAVLLRIDSSRGTVFKNNAISTVLSAIIYKGSERITDITRLHEVFGSGSYLEWSWQKIDDSSFGTILSTDKMVGNDGFTLTISADEVDEKVTFMCELKD